LLFDLISGQGALIEKKCCCLGKKIATAILNKSRAMFDTSLECEADGVELEARQGIIHWSGS